jgi:hypothetical protein
MPVSRLLAAATLLVGLAEAVRYSGWRTGDYHVAAIGDIGASWVRGSPKDRAWCDQRFRENVDSGLFCRCSRA